MEPRRQSDRPRESGKTAVLPARKEFSLTSRVPPHVLELTLKRGIVSGLENRLFEEEAGLARLKGSLKSLEAAMERARDSRMSIFLKVQEQIAEALSRKSPEDSNLKWKAAVARENAAEAARKASGPEGGPPPDPFFSVSPKMAGLLDEGFRRFHPDLAISEGTRLRRRKFLKDLLEAFFASDKEKMGLLVADSLLDAEGLAEPPIEADGTTSELMRLRRRVSRIENRLRDIEEETLELRNNPLYETIMNADRKGLAGDQFLSGMLVSIDEQILEGQIKLEELEKDLFPPPEETARKKVPTPKAPPPESAPASAPAPQAVPQTDRRASKTDPVAPPKAPPKPGTAPAPRETPSPSSQPTLASEFFDLGKNLLFGVGGHQDLQEAARLLTNAAEQGHLEAQLLLGRMSLQGKGMSRNPETGVKWLGRAATGGNIEAMNELGECLFHGTGTLVDIGEALRWFRAAADKGHIRAAFNVGNVYMTSKGPGGSVDYLETAKWFKLAASKGDPDAQYYLGYMHSKGLGVKEDPSEAVRLCRAAAQQGHPASMYGLGYLYLNGQGVAKDVDIAVNWYRQAAEKGNALAQFALGVLYEEGILVPEDLSAAARWFEMAAQQNHAAAQFHLGTLLYEGRCTQADPVRAAQLFESAASNGIVRAQFSLAWCFFLGKGVTLDYVESYAWFFVACQRRRSLLLRDGLTEAEPAYVLPTEELAKARSRIQEIEKALASFPKPPETKMARQEFAALEKNAELGDSEAQFRLALTLYHGEGTSIDFLGAAQWLKKSAKRGHSGAMLLLGCMYRNGNGVTKSFSDSFLWLSVAETRVRSVLARDLTASFRSSVEKKLSVRELARGRELAQDMASKIPLRPGPGRKS